MRLQLDIGMIKQTYDRFNADKAPRLAAAVAYTTLFAIAPALVIIIAVAGNIIAAAVGHGHGHSVVRDQLIAAIGASAGKDAAATVRIMVDSTAGKPHQSLIAQIVGWILLLAGAAGLFAALQDALNTIWEVEPPKKALWGAVRDRLASIGMLLAIGFLLLVTTAINAGVTYVSTYISRALPFAGAGFVFGLINALITTVVVSVLFALMFKYLPDAHIEWRDVRTGAIATAMLFVVGQAAIAFYLGKAAVASAYGAAGSLVVLLLWVYYSSMIFLFGAEFTRVFAEKHGSRFGRSSAKVEPKVVLTSA